MNVHLTAFALCPWPLSGGKDIGLALIGIDRHQYIEEPLLFRAEFAFFFSNQRNLFLLAFVPTLHDYQLVTVIYLFYLGSRHLECFDLS